MIPLKKWWTHYHLYDHCNIIASHSATSNKKSPRVSLLFGVKFFGLFKLETSTKCGINISDSICSGIFFSFFEYSCYKNDKSLFSIFHFMQMLKSTYIENNDYFREDKPYHEHSKTADHWRNVWLGEVEKSTKTCPNLNCFWTLQISSNQSMRIDSYLNRKNCASNSFIAPPQKKMQFRWSVLITKALDRMINRF